MDRNKILDKIKKCLALGKSPNEHEAASALRQAQKLIDKHGITDAELGAIGYTWKAVDLPVQAGKSIPEYIRNFAWLMNKAFGVYILVGRSRRVSDISFTIQYYGLEPRVMMAEYAHVVIWRAMSNAWTRYLKEHPEVKGMQGARSGFLIGWLDSVQKKVMDIGLSQDEKQALQKYVLSITTPSKGKINSIKVDAESYYAGRDNGSSFSIHKPMNKGKESLKLEN